MDCASIDNIPKEQWPHDQHKEPHEAQPAQEDVAESIGKHVDRKAGPGPGLCGESMRHTHTNSQSEQA